MRTLSALPQNVENFPVGMNSDEHIGHGDKLEVGLFGIRKEHLGLPDGLDQVGVRQVHGLLQIRVGQAGVPPLLPEVRVGHIVLKGDRTLVHLFYCQK